VEKEFVSSKIRDVGENTLETHLLTRIYQDPFLCLSHLLDTHLYLTLGVEKLVRANLVHLDINKTNVIFDDKIQCPILTEFGLSCKIPLERHVEVDTCLEMHFISNMVKIPKWETKTIKTDDWNQIMESYFDEMAFVPDSLKQEAKKKWKFFIQKQTHKKGNQIWSELNEFWKTWDNYSVLKMYASLLYRFQTEENFPSCTFLESYRAVLLSSILSTPKDRDTPTETLSKLDVLVHSIDKEDYHTWIKNWFHVSKQE
jgi:serine/threonine protein kinase